MTIIDPVIITRGTTYYTKRPAGAEQRVVRGVVLHHTGGMQPVRCHENGSWHYLIDRDGTLYVDVPSDDVAWHIAATDRWQPLWVAKTCSWFSGSAVNTCTIGIEIVSAAGNTPITDEQINTLKFVANELREKYGELWWIGHGQAQKDRRLTEPDNLPWDDLMHPFDQNNGRRWKYEEEFAMSEAEKRLIEAVRELGFIDHAEATIRIVAGLGANETSIEAWISEIGALKAQLEEAQKTQEQA
jgi:N-acetyl-anhydromuramyl-L-alanine amidase AmpD